MFNTHNFSVSSNLRDLYRRGERVVTYQPRATPWEWVAKIVVKFSPRALPWANM